MENLNERADPIRNVSGTAFWIATYRAMETRKPAPLFRDPWAEQLAGERGERVMKQFWGSKMNAWIWITRTAVIDQFILDSVAESGIDTLINLGAGLDTRAFRLELPQNLRWFDVDKAEIVAHKRSVLGRAPARCRYVSLAADLGVDPLRRRLLADCAVGAKKVLVLTEGLLEYLTPDAVRTLGRELHALPAHTWVCNLHSKAALDRAGRWRRVLARVEAPVHFAPACAPEFFREVGWKEVEWASMIERAMAFDRMPTLYRPAIQLVRWAPARMREEISRFLGIARLERIEGAELQARSANGFQKQTSRIEDANVK